MAISGDSRRGRGTIVLAEDFDLVRRLATEVLSESGYRVLAAADGREALALLAEYRGRIDLLLTDDVLPEMSGRRLVATVRSMRPGIPILFVSTDPWTLAGRGAGEPGVACLEKPFTPDVLVRKVQEILRGTE